MLAINVPKFSAVITTTNATALYPQISNGVMINGCNTIRIIFSAFAKTNRWYAVTIDENTLRGNVNIRLPIKKRYIVFARSISDVFIDLIK